MSASSGRGGTAGLEVHAPTWRIARRHRVAIVGFGGVVQGCHLPAYRAIGERFGIDVVAAVEPDPDRRKLAEEEHGIEAFSGLAEMLATARPDVVDVTVPPAGGKEAVIRECLAAGCHVLAQKPFLYDLGEAAALVAEAEAAGLQLAVNVQARYAPAFHGAAELIRRGLIGEVRSAQIGSTFPLPGDTTVDMGIHEFDLLRYWIGREARRVATTITELDEAHRALLTVQFDFGDAAALLIEESHSPVILPWSFRVVGTEGVLDGQEQFGSLEGAALKLYLPGAQPVRVPLPYSYHPDAFAHVMASLLEAIEGGTEAPTSARDHLHSLAGVLAAQRAGRSGDWEDI